MEFAPLLVLPILIIKVIDFVRYAKAKDVNGVTTQLLVWGAGVGALMLVAQTSWADGIPIGDELLGRLGFWSQVYAGLALASTSSLVKDALKAHDNSNSAAIPTLLPAGPHDRTPNKGGVAATDVG